MIMDIRDKKAWLKDNGKLSFTFVNNDKTSFTKHFTTLGGMTFSSSSDNEQSMYGNLYDKIKDNLFEMCK